MFTIERMRDREDEELVDRALQVLAPALMRRRR